MSKVPPEIHLIPKTRTQTEAEIAVMSADDRKHLSAAWLNLLAQAAEVDPWVLGFETLNLHSVIVGSCGFKGPPDNDGMVEFAYGSKPEFEGKGYATAAAQALLRFPFSDERVRLVRAHTISDQNASASILRKCSFRLLGQVHDPEDGMVCRWEKLREENPNHPATT